MRSSRLFILLLLAGFPGVGWAAPQYLVLPSQSAQRPATTTSAHSISTVAAETHIFSVGSSPTFELEFPELRDRTGTGFDHGALGAQRREIALQVFTRVSQVLDGEPGRARIRLDSRSPWLDQHTLAVGIPYFRCTDGFQKPIIFDALRKDEHVHEVEGELLVNFALPLHAATAPPPIGQYDLYTLLFHEAMHILGFVGFSVDPDGRAPDCGGGRMLPEVAAFATNDAGQRLWVERDGNIEYTGHPGELPEDGRAIKLDQALASHGTLKLASSRLRVSGHWLPEDFEHRPGVLMLKEPFPSGQIRRNLTPETKAILGAVLGYRVGEALRGLTGSWVDPDQRGQGITLHFISADRFAIYFFGFTESGERLWLVGLHNGAFTLGSTLEVPLFEATGGRFSDASDHTTTVLPWGTVQLNFMDCLSAEASLTGMDGTKQMRLLPLARVDTLDCF